MKNKLLIFSILILCTSSCNYLEYDESDFLEKDAVFSSFQYTRDFLTNIYSYVPAAFGTIGGDALRSAACDEAVYVDKLSPVHSFNNGAWSAINTLDDRWNYFRGIRAVNMFLQEVEGQEFDELKHNEDYEDIMAQFKYYPYEARFLRAYFILNWLNVMVIFLLLRLCFLKKKPTCKKGRHSMRLFNLS